MSEENTPVEEPTEVDTVTVEDTVEPEVVKPKDKPKEKAAPVAEEVVSTDPVYLSRCIYMNRYERNSLSVRHVQRRLTDLGYRDADADPKGWYKENTRAAVEKFQADSDLNATGLIDAVTLEALFEGDKAVTVVID